MEASRQRAGVHRRLPRVALPRLAATPEARAMLQAARLQAARPYVMRWRPWVVTIAAALGVGLRMLFDVDRQSEATIPLALAAIVAWSAALAVRMGISAIDAALVMSFADLPLVAAWAMASPDTDERLTALLATLLIAAWLFGPFATGVLGVGVVVTLMLVWVLHDPWSLQPVPDALWIVLAGAILSIIIAREIEGTMLGAVRHVRASRDEVASLTGMRNRLAADVSHELRTPLTAINGFIDTLLREDIDVDSELAHQLLEQARQGGERLEQLITNLLDVERVAVGSMQLYRSEHPIGPMLEVAIARVATGNRRVEVVYDRTLGAASRVSVDYRRFVQIIGYLVENGIEHGSGTVTVRCSRRLDELIVDVCDEGPGVPPGHADHIFEPFVSFGDHVGSPGIGLSLARSLAVVHGGRLDYLPGHDDSRHSFRLRIPAWHDD